MPNETIITTPSATNAPEATYAGNTANLSPFKRISWTAIFVGAIVAIGLSFLLGLFGTALGFSIFSMTRGGGLTLAVGGVLGIIISIIITMLAAGYAAGYLGRLYCPHRNLGILYGFTTWSVALMLSALFTTHMSTYVPAYSNVGALQAGAPMRDSQGTPKATPDGSRNPLDIQQSSSPMSANQAMPVNTSPGALAWGAFTVFVMFFISALFCCIGASWGMNCRRPD